MTINELIEYVQEEYGVVADYPFSDEKVPSPVFRHKHNKKWFAIGMNVSKNRICTESKTKVWVINLKCDPFLKGALLEEKGVYPAYHMNKEHWISAILEEVEKQTLLSALQMSFDLTKK